MTQVGGGANIRLALPAAAVYPQRPIFQCNPGAHPAFAMVARSIWKPRLVGKSAVVGQLRVIEARFDYARITGLCHRLPVTSPRARGRNER